jgi:hypothetical protein
MENEDAKKATTKDDTLESVLFPGGIQGDQDQIKFLYEQYKLLMQSMEQLAARRQSINGFFLSLNTFLLAGVGFIFKESFEVFVHEHRVTNLMILTIALSLVGFMLDANWAALLLAYGKLLRRQTHVALAMEKHLVAAPVTAQSLTHQTDLYALADIERRVACTFQVIFVLCGVGAVVLIVATHH